jgi:hypothetical protein
MKWLQDYDDFGNMNESIEQKWYVEDARKFGSCLFFFEMYIHINKRYPNYGLILEITQDNGRDIKLNKDEVILERNRLREFYQILSEHNEDDLRSLKEERMQEYNQALESTQRTISLEINPFKDQMIHINYNKIYHSSKVVFTIRVCNHTTKRLVFDDFIKSHGRGRKHLNYLDSFIIGHIRLMRRLLEESIGLTLSKELRWHEPQREGQKTDIQSISFDRWYKEYPGLVNRMISHVNQESKMLNIYRKYYPNLYDFLKNKRDPEKRWKTDAAADMSELGFD